MTRPSLLLSLLATATLFGCQSTLGSAENSNATSGDANSGVTVASTGNGNSNVINPNLTGEPPTPGARQIGFVNRCSYPVWFAFAGGSTPSVSGSPCQASSDCYPNSSCIQTGSIKQCFWNNPIPANGQYELAANGGNNLVTIPPSAGSGAVWSGVMAGRTGCVNGQCQVADCGNDGAQGCTASRGFSQPTTQAEFTMSTAGTDFYDIEIINGVSVPTSIAPVFPAAQQPNLNASEPYFCGSPGAATASSSLLGGCSWNFTPPSNDYVWVVGGGNACTSDSNCPAGTRCGLSYTPGVSSPLQKTCGAQNGWWTADEVCGLDSSYGSPFNCQQSAGNGLTLNNLYGCTNVGSCYQNGATSDCCGCANWDQSGVKVPAAPYTQQCSSANPNWTNNVLPTLQWMKTACPTAYTYPFDDMSSTFVCSNPHGGANYINYLVTFCPG